jgi:hypothetical protein
VLNIPNRKKCVYADHILNSNKEEKIMQIESLIDIFLIIDILYSYLLDKNISFDDIGLPIFTSDMFLNEYPDLVIPFSQRKNKRVINRKRTVICFFDKDQHLYPRLGKLFSELEEYKSFMGVIGMDITFTDDMDEEWQKIIALLNQLFLAVLAVNGIKIVINTRSAGLAADCILKNVPLGVMAASGFLGCDTLDSEEDLSYLKKILRILPEKLIIYGKDDLKAEMQLSTMGIDYKVFKDFHRLCKEVRHG